jgi:hypothetical protein
MEAAILQQIGGATADPGLANGKATANGAGGNSTGGTSGTGGPGRAADATGEGSD